MLFSIWLGMVIVAGQTGCSTISNKPAFNQQTAMLEARPAQPVTGNGAPNRPVQRGLRNPDYNAIPKVPPPGARITYNSARINAPYIAITFDDGPQPSNTPRLLKMLRERNIKATFFVVGELAREHPEIIRAILADGHEIGNHTMKHPLNMTRLSDDKINEEVGGLANLLQEIAGYRSRLFRPPGGNTNDHIRNMLYNQYGYLNILWSVDPNDWKKPGVSVVTRRLVSGAQNGGILLCHDLHKSTVDAMPDTLDQLLAKGFHFVTVSQLINMEASGPAPVAAASPTPQAPEAASAQPPGL
jgi:peptidoglycan/xylan/chitin deacetylase (PgdA/CDA1 family)